MSEANIPIDCATCGFFIGTGLPGSTQFCSRCQNFVIARARGGNLGAALGALAVVGIFIVVGALIAEALGD